MKRNKNIKYFVCRMNSGKMSTRCKVAYQSCLVRFKLDDIPEMQISQSQKKPILLFIGKIMKLLPFLAFGLLPFGLFNMKIMLISGRV